VFGNEFYRSLLFFGSRFIIGVHKHICVQKCSWQATSFRESHPG
jgi:hypothetical protein